MLMILSLSVVYAAPLGLCPPPDYGLHRDYAPFRTMAFFPDHGPLPDYGPTGAKQSLRRVNNR